MIKTIKLKDDKKFQTLSITETGDMVELKGSRLFKDLNYIKSRISQIEAAGTQAEDELVYDKIKGIKELLKELEDQE